MNKKTKLDSRLSNRLSSLGTTTFCSCSFYTCIHIEGTLEGNISGVLEDCCVVYYPQWHIHQNEKLRPIHLLAHDYCVCVTPRKYRATHDYMWLRIASKRCIYISRPDHVEKNVTAVDFIFLLFVQEISLSYLTYSLLFLCNFLLLLEMSHFRVPGSKGIWLPKAISKHKNLLAATTLQP